MERLGFPKEVVTKMPRVAVTGSELVFIEQHEGIVTYRGDLIVFKTALGLITIHGQGMEIMKYGKQDALVKGGIISVNYPEKAGKQGGD